MKKVVLMVKFSDGKIETKAIKAVKSLSGVESYSLEGPENDLNWRELTIIGVMDPVAAMVKLRKLCYADLLSVGPAEEESEEVEPEEVEEEEEEEVEKLLLEVELHDDRTKRKAMKKVSGLSGVDSVSVDIKDHKMTLTGDMDAAAVVGKLRKLCNAEILSDGPAEDEWEPKEAEETEDNEREPEEQMAELANKPQYPYYYYVPVGQKPNHACVIC